jgi:hypothetical protein
MFTAQLIGDRKDEQARRRIINVKFTSPEREFDQEFQFSISEEVAKIKRIVNNFLGELNAELDTITDLTPDAPPTPPVLTQDELDRNAWDLDVMKLKKAQELLNCGVTFSAGQLTSLATIRGRVATNFKAEYLT